MSRLTTLGLLLYGIVLAGLAVLKADVLALAIPLGVYILIGLWFQPAQPQLEVRRSLSAHRVLPDTEVDIHLSILNKGETIESALIECLLPGGLEVVEGSTRRLTRLEKGESIEMHCRVQGLRGEYTFPPVRVHASDLLGLSPKEMDIEAPDTLTVLPAVTRLQHIPIRPPHTHGFHGMIPAQRGGPGIAFYNLRDYQPGDPMRWINWRQSARHQHDLYTNTFQQDSAADVGLLLDARMESYASAGQSGLFEYAVQATASLSAAFIAQGNRVGLVHFGHYMNWTHPGYGRHQQERILDALASARITPTQADHLEFLSSRFLRPGSQLVLISPLQAQDLETLLRLRSRRYALLVISPDPVSFELTGLPDTPETRLAGRIARLERLAFLKPLQRAGIAVLNWNARQPFDQAMNSVHLGALSRGGR